MPQPTDYHVDQVLTDFSVAYLQMQNEFVAREAFTSRPVGHSSDSYYTYTAAYWLTDEMQPRQPGANYPESGWELSTDTYKCERWALAKPIADEERGDADEAINLDQDAAEWLEQKNLIRHERSVSTDFMTTGIWTTDNTTATDWDATGGVPITNVQVARRTIKNATGQRANAILMGEIVHDGLVTNAQITALLQYSQRALPRDVDAILAAALGLDFVYVSRATYDSAAEGVTSSVAPIIDDDALVYVKKPTANGLKTATAVLQFYWPEGGGLGTYTRVRVDERDSDIARIKAAWDYKKIAATLGYFFSDIV